MVQSMPACKKKEALLNAKPPCLFIDFRCPSHPHNHPNRQASRDPPKDSVSASLCGELKAELKEAENHAKMMDRIKFLSGAESMHCGVV